LISTSYKATPASENICQALKDRIVSGKYPPRMIISEKEICEEFGVSRTPFREAIKKLEELGLLEVVPRFGTYVSEVNFHEVKYALEVRQILEPRACRLAAERRTEEQLSKLEALLREGEDIIKDRDSIILRTGLDKRCHEAIYEATHNPVLAAESERILAICARIWTSSFRVEVSLSEIVSQWGDIFMAVKTQNGEAAEALMTEHMRYTINLLRNHFF
jgi:DNA-binding GntR family transcriptional regulator